MGGTSEPSSPSLRPTPPNAVCSRCGSSSSLLLPSLATVKQECQQPALPSGEYTHIRKEGEGAVASSH